MYSDCFRERCSTNNFLSSLFSLQVLMISFTRISVNSLMLYWTCWKHSEESLTKLWLMNFPLTVAILLFVAFSLIFFLTVLLQLLWMTTVHSLNLIIVMFLKEFCKQTIFYFFYNYHRSSTSSLFHFTADYSFLHSSFQFGLHLSHLTQ